MLKTVSIEPCAPLSSGFIPVCVPEIHGNKYVPGDFHGQIDDSQLVDDTATTNTVFFAQN